MASAVLAAPLAGCGGDDGVGDVNAFVREANEVQQRSAPAFERANKTFVEFSKGDLSSGDAGKQLAAAEKEMRRTRDDIAALEAPMEAERLQQLLVELYDADAALAHESTLLARFVPESSDATRPLGRIARDLTRSLRTADTAEGQMRALRRYAKRVAGVIDDLEPLKPPPLLIDRHHEQVEHLRRVRRLALQLVEALDRQDDQAVARLLLRFRRLNTQDASGALPPRALDAYNDRYLGVRDRHQAVEREQARLEKELG